MNQNMYNQWIRQCMCKWKMNHDARRQEKFHRIFAIVILVVISLFVALSFVGCKTVGTVNENVNVRDSVAIRWKDSTAIHWIDSIRYTNQHVITDDSTSLIINFGQGGGTYNAKTGEATNVAGVQQIDTHYEERDSSAYYRSLSEDYKHVADSLSAQVTNLQSQYESVEKKARSGYARFTSWWFWITAILLLLKVACLVCEKIPATAPYVMIARKFIPFL